MAAEGTDDFNRYSRKVMAYSAALAAVGAVALLIVTYRGAPELFAGFCLGATFSMLKWRLLIRELKRFARGESGRVGHYLRSFFIRYALTGAVIAVSLLSAAFSPVTTVIGIFLVNMVIIGEQMLTVLRGRARSGGTWE